MPIHLNVVVKVKPEKATEVVSLFQTCAEQVRKEKGCVKYIMAKDLKTEVGFQDPLREDTYIILEEWSTMEDLKSHLAQEPLRVFTEKTNGWITLTGNIMTDV